MATALKLRSDIKKLKKAIETKGISDSVKSKLKVQLEKAENELSAMQKTGKAPKKSSVAGTKKTLTALEKLLQKKKFGIYKGKGVDIKKDAERPALPIGKRKSKSGNTYYEYRANRIDVRQPSKKFKIKLKDGGMMDKGGQFSGKDWYAIRSFDISKYGEQGAKEKADKYIERYVEYWKNTSTPVENKDLKIRKSQFGGIDYKGEYVVMRLLPKYADGGMMARGGYVSKGELVWRKLSNVDRANFLQENFTPEITPMSQHLLVGKDFNFLPKKVKIKLESKYANVEDYADGGMMAKGGSLDSKLKKYATEDVNLIQKEGGMAITDTKLGVIFGEHKVGVFTFSNRDGKTLFSGNKDEAIDFVKNNYQVEGMADGGMMAKGGYVAVSENDGYWYIISTPTTKEKAQQIIDMGVPKGEVGKVVTLAEAKAHKKVIGEEYLEGGGMMARGGIYSSEELYIVKVFDGKSGELLDMSKRVWAKNLSQAQRMAMEDFEDEMKSKYGDHLRFKVEEAPSMMARGGKLSDNFSSEIQEGDIVWDSGNKRYGVVLNTYDFKYGEIRLDSDGNQPLENLHKLGSEGDKGTKDKLVAALVAHKRLMVEYPDRYEKVNYADGGMMARGGYNTGRSWHLDRAKHNKAESWERPLNQRKKEDGGIISTIHRNSN